MNKKIIGGIIGVVALGGVGGVVYQNFGVAPKVTLDNPQVIQWTKPSTDAGWAEDVKAENFDIKSTGKLTEMKEVHEAKLLRVQTGKKEVFECRPCIDFKYKEANPSATQAEINANYTDELAKANWEVEKLKQSVERMDNEFRLREKGFVVADKTKEGVKTKQLDLDKATIIRKIND